MRERGVGEPGVERDAGVAAASLVLASADALGTRVASSLCTYLPGRSLDPCSRPGGHREARMGWW